jgi:short-subunit dehydrogenase
VTEFARWIKKIDAKHPFDLVIANAGLGLLGRKETLETTQEVFDVNLQGALNTIFSVLGAMKQRKKGQIALMSSLASFKGYKGKGAYCASKAAVRVFGEALREDLEPYNINVSVICPGFVATPLTSHNKFYMPLLMQPSQAAKIIQRGLEKNKPRIAFPFPVYFIAWVMAALPPSIAEKISKIIPYR